MAFVMVLWARSFSLSQAKAEAGDARGAALTDAASVKRRFGSAIEQQVAGGRWR
jgi:hypothetical protein